MFNKNNSIFGLSGQNWTLVLVNIQESFLINRSKYFGTDNQKNFAKKEWQKVKSQEPSAHLPIEVGN